MGVHVHVEREMEMDVARRLPSLHDDDNQPWGLPAAIISGSAPAAHHRHRHSRLLTTPFTEKNLARLIVDGLEIAELPCSRNHLVRRCEVRGARCG